MVRFAFQNGAFCVPKVAVLRCKMVRFAKQYSGTCKDKANFILDWLKLYQAIKSGEPL